VGSDTATTKEPGKFPAFLRLADVKKPTVSDGLLVGCFRL